MAEQTRFYLSYHENDAPVVEALRRHLNMMPPLASVQYDDFNSLPPKEPTTEFTRTLIEAADVVLVFCSADYFNREETLRERDYAKRSPRRPLIIPLLCKAVAAQPGLEEYALVPVDGVPLSNQGKINELQCTLAARLIAQRSAAFREHHKPIPEWTPEPLSWEAARTRLQAFVYRNDIRITLRLLHHLIKDPGFDKIIFEAGEQYERLHRRTQREQQSVEAFLEAMDTIRLDLQQLLLRLEPEQLRPDWQQVLQIRYFGFAPLEKPDSVIPGLGGLADEIILPDTHSADAAAEEPGITTAQQQEFRRLFILAQDAQAIGQFSKAHALADQIRTTIDPESAQLYELLLVTLVQMETPDRIVQTALDNNTRLIDKVLRYAGRFREFQGSGKCPSATGYYNVSAVAGTLNSALRRAYAALPNDYIIDTGQNAQKHSDRREAVRNSLRIALDVYNFLHPSDGFLELAFNEFAGGGKYLWVESIAVQDNELQVVNSGEFDVLSEIYQLETLLTDPPLRNPDNLLEMQERNQSLPFEPRELIRDNLLYCLRRKRNGLIAAIREEKHFFREFIDERDSLVRFVYANILGYIAFDQKDPTLKSPFLEMALGELLLKPEVPWFTLDDNGQLRPHPDCARLKFDAIGITSAIIYQHVGENSREEIIEIIRQSVYRQYAAETAELYRQVEQGLAWTDIRRLRDDEARQMLVDCIRRWVTLYRAYPALGEPYLRRAVNELIGEGFFLWMQFNPEQLESHPDSLALGFNAVNAYRHLEQYPLPWSKEYLNQRIIEKLYLRHILPAYQAMPPRDENHRNELIGLFLQSLRGYRTHPEQAYIDWVFRELTEEIKFRWIDITTDGMWTPAAKVPSRFDPIKLLREFSGIDPQRYNRLEMRKQIAERRYQEQEALYFKEISEFRHENRLPERRIAIDIFNKTKGIFKFYPQLRYLEIPLNELSGQGRIRWQARLLGIFVVPENHHENALLNFDYKFARAEFMLLRDSMQRWTEEMLKETENA